MLRRQNWRNAPRPSSSSRKIERLEEQLTSDLVYPLRLRGLSGVRQGIKFLADVICFQRRAGKRNCFVKGLPSIQRAVQLNQKGPLEPMKMKIVGERFGKGLDHCESSLWSDRLGNRHRAVERHDR